MQIDVGLKVNRAAEINTLGYNNPAAASCVASLNGFSERAAAVLLRIIYCAVITKIKIALRKSRNARLGANFFCLLPRLMMCGIIVCLRGAKRFARYTATSGGGCGSQ